MSNLTVENVYLRQSAKEAAKKHRWTLIGMCAILFGVSYAISYGGGALLTAICGSPYTGTAYTNTPNSAYWIGYIVLLLISTLVSSGLTLGLTCATIDLARDTHIVRVRDIFCRMSSCFKAFRLSLWIGLKAFLWALPAVAVTVVLTIALAYNPTSDVSQTLMMLLPLVMMIVVFALMIPAMYRYTLATFILADAPETGVRECVNRSKAIMKGHKWQAFKLPLPFILAIFGLYFAISIAAYLILAFLGGTIASVIAAFLPLAILLVLACIYMPRIYMCHALFYLKRVDEQSPAADTADELPAADVTDESDVVDTEDISTPDEE